jgi:hypothetical protein
MQPSAAPTWAGGPSRAAVLIRILLGWVFRSPAIEKDRIDVNMFLGLLFLLLVGGGAWLLDARFLERRLRAHG